jgi:hypothetical protein
MYLQHFCNLVEVNPVYYIGRRGTVVVLMGSYQGTPKGTAQYFG